MKIKHRIMEMIKLNNGTEIPSIGLGTWELTGDKCKEAVKKALEIGYRHIDTAEIYGNEEEIGEAIRNFKREQLFITSKVWPQNLKYGRVLNAFEGSVSKLGTDYLNLYLIHWPTRGMDLEGSFKALKELYEDGRIKAVGVSNFKIELLKEAIKICRKLSLPLAMNQVEFHPFLYQKELLEFCNKHKIKITAYSPLARGDIKKNKLIEDIGEKYNKSSCQAALNWLLSKGLVVIPKASSERHLKENLDVEFKMDKEDYEKIDNINEHKRLLNFNGIFDD